MNKHNERLFAEKLSGVFSAFGKPINGDGIQVWLDALTRNEIDLFQATKIMDEHIDDPSSGTRVPSPQDIISRVRAKRKSQRLYSIDCSKPVEEAGEKIDQVPIDLLAELAKRESAILKKTKIFSSQIEKARKNGAIA